MLGSIGEPDFFFWFLHLKNGKKLKNGKNLARYCYSCAIAGWQQYDGIVAS
jgi:hypothetical protein